MSKNFYIADLHIGHANAIKFDNRPFADTNEMFYVIRNNWNRAVTNNDTVYILGDFIWRTEPSWTDIVSQLKGQKVLILGNHDPKQFTPEMRSLFVKIDNYMDIPDNGRRVIMSHYPMPFHVGSHRKNCYMLYGHVHIGKEAAYVRETRDMIRARLGTNDWEPQGQFINVGCMEPYMAYTPRTLNEIIAGDAATYPAPKRLQ